MFLFVNLFELTISSNHCYSLHISRVCGSLEGSVIGIYRVQVRGMAPIGDSTALSSNRILPRSYHNQKPSLHMCIYVYIYVYIWCIATGLAK